MTEPVWVEKEALVLLHGKSIARFGGLEGIRDEGLLESALARPKNAYLYDELHDLSSLCASYAFGLIKNHPFADGNKRVAFMAVGLFLGANRQELNTGRVEAIKAVEALAGGEISELQFAAWLRLHIKPLQQKL